VKIREIEIKGYRSVKEMRLPLKQLTVLVGPNGSGKSNIYQAIQLMAAAAKGQFARSIVQEGGMRSILWAGGFGKTERPRVGLAVHGDELSYEIEFGLVPISERPHDSPRDNEDDDDDEASSAEDDEEDFEDTDIDCNTLSVFRGDPDIKTEQVHLMNGKKKVSLLKRKRGNIIARNMDGRNITYPATIAPSESVLSELREPQKFPELSTLRIELSRWRFYHEFRTDLHSPLRQPQLATMTPIMSDDGSDLTAALATIRAMGNGKELVDEFIEHAFPGSKLYMHSIDNELTMVMSFPGVYRPMDAREFSDGTLQYLCLLAALMTSRPAPFVVLNEPETSIHPDLLGPLAELIISASKRSQILLTTHSKDLANLIKAKGSAQIVELEKIDGATKIHGTSVFQNRVTPEQEAKLESNETKEPAKRISISTNKAKPQKQLHARDEVEDDDDDDDDEDEDEDEDDNIDNDIQDDDDDDNDED
jgi:predicted ATPase